MREMEQVIDDAKKALEQGRPEEALIILDQLSLKNNPEMIFLKGEIYYKMEKWGEALNQFSSFLEYFPDDKKAISYRMMIQNILGYFHKDLYNP